jgi:hypothetical protein
MTPFFGLLLILFITFVGVRFLSSSTILKTPLFSGLIVSGVPYILIGVLLGPQLFNFISENIIESLNPLISMAIGWVGLLFGLQLRWRNLRRFPKNYMLFTFLQTTITFTILLVGLGLVFYFLVPSTIEHRLEAIIILAAVGSMTAPLSVARILIEKKIKGRLAHLLQFVSSLDSFYGLVVAGITMAIIHSPAIQWIQEGWQWLVLSIFISVSVGLIFGFLLRHRFLKEEIFLVVFGLVIFTSGMGFYFKLSPIFLNLIVGITIAQFPRESEKVMRVIQPAEKPAYIFLLVFAGALWNYRFWEEILLIIAFIIFRYIGKYLGGYITSRNIDCAFPIPHNVGTALLSFGGISLALALNFQLFYGGFMGDFLMSATILGIFLFDEYAALSIQSLLRKQGELS